MRLPRNHFFAWHPPILFPPTRNNVRISAPCKEAQLTRTTAEIRDGGAYKVDSSRNHAFPACPGRPPSRLLIKDSSSRGGKRRRKNWARDVGIPLTLHRIPLSILPPPPPLSVGGRFSLHFPPLHSADAMWCSILAWRKRRKKE